MLLRSPRRGNKQWHNILYICWNQWRRIVCALIGIHILLLWNDRKHPFVSYPRAITNYDVEFEAVASKQNASLSPNQIKNLCRAHLWKPYSHPRARRKVYDILMVNDEMDWLEIRLNTLASEVDYFVILESPVTFTGRAKPLVLKENWARFEQFHAQIIYQELENPPIGASRTWDYEDFQRNAMFLQAFPRMTGKQVPHLGDIILVSDVDEVPRPATLMILRNCNVPRRVTLRSRFYYYGFQTMHAGEEWAHPQATIFGGFKPGQTILPADLRNGEGGNRLVTWWDKADLRNAGWHCSTCFATIEQVLTKLGSFSHTSLNHESFRDPVRIVDRVRKGKDLWDREGEEYVRVDSNEDIPEFLKADRNRWGYLLDRDGSNAAFKDFEYGAIPGE